MAVQLPNLPYAENALEPHYSAKTISFHYGKHHKAYVDNLNKLIAGTPLEDKALEEIVMACAGDSSRVGMFNNAAQVWNHTFFWNCMKPAGGGRPKGDLAQRIDQSFGATRSSSSSSRRSPSAASAADGDGSSWTAAR